jgi:hypothetical protein
MQISTIPVLRLDSEERGLPYSAARSERIRIENLADVPL